MAVKSTKTKRRVGAPTKFTDSAAHTAVSMFRVGATDQEVCDALGINIHTISNWRKRWPWFMTATKEAQEIANTRVSQSMFRKAVGYTVTEKQAIKIKVGPQEERVEIVEVERHVPPDTTAQIFWLKNRDKENWADTYDHKVKQEEVPVDQLAHAILNAILDAKRQHDDADEQGVLQDQRATEAG